MQKIIKQDFSLMPEEQAKKIAQFTWKKDEIAWFFDTTWYDIFKVIFTGEHWVICNGVFRGKVYQFRYLESSGDHDIKAMSQEGINHDFEDIFFTTKNEAIARGRKYLKKREEDASKKFKEAKARLTTYRKIK